MLDYLKCPRKENCKILEVEEEEKKQKTNKEYKKQRMK